MTSEGGTLLFQAPEASFQAAGPGFWRCMRGLSVSKLEAFCRLGYQEFRDQRLAPVFGADWGVADPRTANEPMNPEGFITCE